MRTPYPRTPHLPWSPGASSDDVRTGDLSGLAGREVVVTEKLDGENTTLYADGLHARSPDSAHHPSRAWVKALQGRVGRAIPPGRRICGENMFARHSLGYRELDSWFYAFSVWDGERCLDWDATVRFTRRLGIPVPKVLWRGVFDERALRGLKLATDRVEGYVVRTVAGFDRARFGSRVAKWVRPSHVTTDAHWMLAPVVPNGLGPAAVLWDVRSGAAPDAAALLAATGLTAGDLGGPAAVERAAGAAADAAGRLDLLGRTGDARLAGVLAALAVPARRGVVAGRLAGPRGVALGVPLARRVADLAGLCHVLRRPFPDEERRAGLVRLASAVDVGALHAVAAALPGGAREREAVQWSELWAREAGLLGPEPLEALRREVREALDVADAAAGDRCWAVARQAYALGRIGSGRQAAALTWRWRSGAFPRLVQLVGPAGSGKSTFAAGLGAPVVSLDGLRAARGDRADQRANAAVLAEGLARLDEALARAADGGTVVWDATSLNRRERSVVHAVAARRDALLTHAVLVVDDAETARRNADRAHPVPAAVLARQLDRFAPPSPAEADRTWYVDAHATVRDTAGTLNDADGDGD
ncbi:RNA ligase family protein [Streptomyces sp. SL13]|uniref:RNA ligase family protein n=1 Tax=Streptantibioticus silvisoli TaxID=2705255 RepID=A0AA90K7F9_9ACTN|nr:RNA ligase family protein [Streptantibioticus silvisoli]MDI5968232.1 RNA ligase family protein [Streptantibioticus silvisoli]